MSLSNRVVGAVLRSPAHRLLSRTTDLIRYEGRRSGRIVETPTQYVAAPDNGGDPAAGLVILVGRPGTKRWWRNFVGGHPVDVLVAGKWLPMTGTVVRAADDPDTAERLLGAYLARFPRAAGALPADPAERRRTVTLVECRPRPS